MNKKDLWLRIKDYHFDNLVPANVWSQIREAFGGADASTKAFAAKIARKHGWKKRFALKAVTEYKKFVYLGVVSEVNVTPSLAIDVVWHEHILFSKAYREFCDIVIEYTFDHSPELLPLAGQTGQFSRQYLDTMELYANEFGIDAPQDIWGMTKFDKSQIKSKKQAELYNSDTGGAYLNDTPLYSYFETADHASYPEFSGFEGGDFGGAGSSGEWSDSSADASDSGTSSCSVSSCSSSCGGGD